MIIILKIHSVTKIFCWGEGYLGNNVYYGRNRGDPRNYTTLSYDYDVWSHLGRSS